MSFLYDIAFLNHYLAIATIGVQALTLVLLCAYTLRSSFSSANSLGNFIRKWGLWLGLLVTTGGIVLSLYYSEVLGIAPCGLCWLQRVFLYPQAALFALAIFKKDRYIADYSIALSVFGFIVGGYQHYLQMGGTDVVPCPASVAGASGITADCAQRFLFEFGYITFPLMSVSLFAFLIAIMLFVRGHVLSGAIVRSEDEPKPLF